MIIRARNLLDNQAQWSYLDTAYAKGVSTVTVKNPNGYAASWAVQFGKTGEEQAEIILLGTSAISGNTLVFATTTLYAHPADTPVYAVKYNQIVFERSTAGTSGTASAITGGTVTIHPDSLYTDYDDTSGSTSYAYKTYYQNSVTAEMSPESDWLTSDGFSFYSLAKMRERIKRKLISANYIQSDELIDDWINEWLEQMTNAAISVNKDYSIGTVDISYSGTAQLGTITSSDFKEIRKVDYTQDGSSWYSSTKMDLTGFQPDQVFSETHPYYYYQGDTVLGRRPADTSGTARVYYYKQSTKLTNDTDEIPVSMRNYTKSFVDYGYAQACLLDQKDEKGFNFLNIAKAELELFKTEIAPRAKSGPQYINIVAPLSTEDDSELI